MSDHPIPDDAWRTIVRYMPIPSVDLLVVTDGGLLLGKRENEPARGEWFVPGGTVVKNERLTDAVHRVADEELGTDITIEKRLGTHEHFYNTADVEDNFHETLRCDRVRRQDGGRGYPIRRATFGVRGISTALQRPPSV